MFEYQLLMISFWLSLTAQYTAVAVWLWEDWFGWSRTRLVLTTAPLLAVTAFALMLGIIGLFTELERRKIARLNDNDYVVLFGWALLGGLAYGPLAVMGLRVVRGWGMAAAWAVGIMGGLIGGAALTLAGVCGLAGSVMLLWVLFVLIGNLNRKLGRKTP